MNPTKISNIEKLSLSADNHRRGGQRPQEISASFQNTQSTRLEGVIALAGYDLFPSGVVRK
jgi:hypothetical protein